MVLLGEAYERAWDKFKTAVEFMPQCADRHQAVLFPPFQIAQPYE